MEQRDRLYEGILRDLAKLQAQVRKLITQELAPNGGGGGMIVHDIVGAYHTVAGAQHNLVGLTATNALGLIAPATLGAYFWRVGGNTLGAELGGGTTDDYDVVIIRNSGDTSYPAVRLVEVGGDPTLYLEASFTNYIVLGQAGGQEITYIYGDRVAFYDGADNIASFNNGAVVFNDDGRDQDFRVETDNDQYAVFVEGSTDRIGFGTGAPQGKVHAVSSVGRDMFWDGTTSAGTALTVIANGTGDVTGSVTIMYSVLAVTGADATGGLCVLTPNTNYVLYDDATDQLTLYCNADGSVTLQRTAGADTWKVALHLVWT